MLSTIRIFKVKMSAGRVTIIDLRFKKRVRIAYNYEFNTSYETAQEFLESIGIKVLNVAEDDYQDCYLLTSNDFNTELTK